MSTTQSPQHQQRDQYPWTGLSEDTEGEKVETWFENAIWHDPLVCSECFARLKESATDQCDSWGNTDTETWRSGSAFLGRSVIAKTEIGERVTRDEDGQVDGTEILHTSTSTYDIVPRTTCGECGSVGGRYQGDALSEQAAVDRVPALLDRLAEMGQAVDGDTVYATVRRFKSDADRTSNDKRVFAAAAAMGIRCA